MKRACFTPGRDSSRVRFFDSDIVLAKSVGSFARKSQGRPPCFFWTGAPAGHRRVHLSSLPVSSDREDSLQLPLLWRTVRRLVTGDVRLSAVDRRRSRVSGPSRQSHGWSPIASAHPREHPGSPNACRLESSSRHCIVCTAELPSRSSSSDQTTSQVHPPGPNRLGRAKKTACYTFVFSSKAAHQFK